MLRRSVTLNVLGQVASLCIGFAGSIVLARWLGPADRGLLGIMLSVSSLALTIAGIGLPIAVLYYGSQRNPPTGALIGNSLAFAALLGVVLVPAVWLLREPVADLLSDGRSDTTWALAAALPGLVFLEFACRNQVVAELRFAFFNVLTVGSKLLYLVGVLLLVGTLDLGVSGGLIATAVASLSTTLVALGVLVRRERPRLDRRLFRAMTGYGVRVQVGAIFDTLNYRLDVVILQFFAPLSTVGYYVVAQVVAELVLTLARSFQASVSPLVAHYEGDERQAETSAAAIRHHGILAGAAVLANAAVGSLVVLFAYGPSFHPALQPMLILLPGMWFLGTASVVAGDLRGRGRPGLSSSLAGLAAVVTVVLDLLLIPRFGVTGAAVASLLAYVVFGIASLAALVKVSRIPLRELVVPTRADLTLYVGAARRAFALVARRGLPAAEPPQ